MFTNGQIYFISVAALIVVIIIVILLTNVHRLKGGEVTASNLLITPILITFTLALIVGALLQVYNVFSFTSCPTINLPPSPPPSPSPNPESNITSIIITINVPDGGSNGNLGNVSHNFIFDQNTSTYGLLIEPETGLGMIILNRDTQTFGVIVPVDGNNNPIINLYYSGTQINCNTTNGCSAINLTDVLSKEQKDIISTYKGDLPQCAKKGGSDCLCEKDKLVCDIYPTTQKSFNVTATSKLSQPETNISSTSSYSNKHHEDRHREDRHHKSKNTKKSDFKAYNDNDNDNDTKKSDKNDNKSDKHDKSDDEKWDYNKFNDTDTNKVNNNRESKSSYRPYNDNDE